MFENASKGMKYLMIAQLCSVVSLFFGLMSTLGASSGSIPELLLFFAVYALTVIGLNKASEDHPLFRKALYLEVLSVTVTIGQAFVNSDILQQIVELIQTLISAGAVLLVIRAGHELLLKARKTKHETFCKVTRILYLSAVGLSLVVGIVILCFGNNLMTGNEQTADQAAVAVIEESAEKQDAAIMGNTENMDDTKKTEITPAQTVMAVLIFVNVIVSFVSLIVYIFFLNRVRRELAPVMPLRSHL